MLSCSGNDEAAVKQLEDPDTASCGTLIKLEKSCLPTVTYLSSHNRVEQHPFIFKVGLMAFPFSCHPLFSSKKD